MFLDTRKGGATDAYTNSPPLLTLKPSLKIKHQTPNPLGQDKQCENQNENAMKTPRFCTNMHSNPLTLNKHLQGDHPLNV